MNKSQATQNAVMLALSEAGCTVFRNETGNFWAGTVAHRSGDTVTLTGARMIRCGLAKGSHDVIGITPLTITPEMVGQTIGVFTSVEVKSGSGRPTKDQVTFQKVVNGAGGIAGVVWSAEQARELVEAAMGLDPDTDNNQAG